MRKRIFLLVIIFSLLLQMVVGLSEDIPLPGYINNGLVELNNQGITNMDDCDAFREVSPYVDRKNPDRCRFLYAIAHKDASLCEQVAHIQKINYDCYMYTPVTSHPFSLLSYLDRASRSDFYQFDVAPFNLANSWGGDLCTHTSLLVYYESNFGSAMDSRSTRQVTGINQCRIWYAQAYQDASLCDNINSSFLRERYFCYRGTPLISEPLSLLADLEKTEFPGYTLDIDEFDRANEWGVNLCSNTLVMEYYKVSGTGYQENNLRSHVNKCITEYAKVHQDSSYCERLTDNAFSEMCYAQTPTTFNPLSVTIWIKQYILLILIILLPIIAGISMEVLRSSRVESVKVPFYITIGVHITLLIIALIFYLFTSIPEDMLLKSLIFSLPVILLWASFFVKWKPYFIMAAIANCIAIFLTIASLDRNFGFLLFGGLFSLPLLIPGAIIAVILYHRQVEFSKALFYSVMVTYIIAVILFVILDWKTMSFWKTAYLLRSRPSLLFMGSPLLMFLFSFFVKRKSYFVASMVYTLFVIITLVLAFILPAT